MKDYPYTITRDQILLYPYKPLRLPAIGILLAYLGFTGYNIYANAGDTTDLSGLIGSASVLLGIGLVMLSLTWKCIAIDKPGHTITLRLFGISYRRISFGAIAGIEEVTHSSYFAGRTSFHLKLKKNFYGKGIALCIPYPARSKAYATIRSEVLPAVTAALQLLPPDQAKPAPPAAIDISNLQFYSTDGYRYVIYMRSPCSRVWNALLAAAFLFAGVSFIMAPGQENELWYIIFLWALGIIWLPRVFSKTVFDLSTRMVTHLDWYGLRKRRFPCTGFVRFNILRNTHNGIYTGTVLEMQLKNSDGNITTLALRKFYKVSSIETCIDETSYLLKA